MPVPLLQVLYAGEPMIEILEDGTHRTVSSGVNQARIQGSKLDVVNHFPEVLSQLQQLVKCGNINPYRDAVRGDPEAVLKEIPRQYRNGMRAKEIANVLKAVNTIAKRSEQ